MITEYLDAAMAKARYEILEDGTYYGEIPGFTGVWAQSEMLSGCQKELRETLEEWLLIKVRKSSFIPKVDNYSLQDVVCRA